MKKMIGKSLRRIVACILVLTLVMAGMYVSGKETKAAENVTIHLTDDGLQYATNHAGAERYYIWIPCEEGAVVPGDSVSTPKTGLKVTVDDGTTTTEHEMASGHVLTGSGKNGISLLVYYDLLPSPTTMTETGKIYTVTLHAGDLTDSSGNVTTIAETVSLVFVNGSCKGFSNRVRFATAGGGYQAPSANNRWLLSYYVEDEMSISGTSWNTTWKNIKVTIDNGETSTDHILPSGNSSCYTSGTNSISLTLSHNDAFLPTTTNELISLGKNWQITIHAGTYQGTDGTYMTILEPATLIITSSAAIDGNLLKSYTITNTGSNSAQRANDWLVYLNSEESIDTSHGALVNCKIITSDGTNTEELSTYIANLSSGLALVLPFGDVLGAKTSMDSSKIYTATIQPGIVKGETSGDFFKINEPVEIVFTSTGVHGVKVYTHTEIDVPENNGGSTGFNLQTIEEDALPYVAGDWSNYIATTVNGGIYVNGTEQRSIDVVKYNKYNYYVRTWRYVNPMPSDSKIEIKNCLLKLDGRVIALPDMAFEFDGTYWNRKELATEMSTFTVTSVSGGCNANQWVIGLGTSESISIADGMKFAGLDIQIIDDEGNVTQYDDFTQDRFLVLSGGEQPSLCIPHTVYTALPNISTMVSGKYHIVRLLPGEITDSNGTVYSIENAVDIVLTKSGVQGILTCTEKTVKARANFNTSATAIYLDTTTDDGFEGTAFSVVAGSLDYNGTEKTLSTVNKDANVKNLYYIPLSSAGINAANGDVITMEFLIRNSSTGLVTTIPKCTVAYENGKWVDAETPEIRDLVFESISGTTTNEDGTKTVAFLTSADVQGLINVTAYKLDVKVGDSLYAAQDFVKTGTNSLSWTVSAELSNELDGQCTEILIPAVDDICSNYGTLNLTEDFKFYCNVDGTYSVQENANLQLDLEKDRTDVTNLYLNGDRNFYIDTFNEDWNRGLKPVDDNSGVFINGTKITVRLQNVLKNLADGKYKIWFVESTDSDGNWINSVQTGDKVTIKGTFRVQTSDDWGYTPPDLSEYETATICFNELNVWWDGSKWITYEPITSDTLLLSDMDGNGDLNSMDIVRIKRYLDGQEIGIYKTGADANESGAIDVRDLYTLYEHILEGVKLTSGEKHSYTSVGVPYYADDEDIFMLAYQGPRAGGKYNYHYTPDANGYLYKDALLSSKELQGTLTSEYVSTSFINKYEFQQYKDAGMTTLITEGDASWTNHDKFGLGGGMYAQLKYYMLVAQEVGLDVIVTSTGINAFIADMNNAEYGVTTKADGTSFNYTKEYVVEDLTELVSFMNGENSLEQWGIDEAYITANYPAEYLDRMLYQDVVFDNFIGIQLADEVDITCIDKFNYVIEEMKKLKPDCVFFSTSLLTGDRTGSNPQSLSTVMDSFTTKTHQFTFDKYMFRKEITTSGIFTTYGKVGDAYVGNSSASENNWFLDHHDVAEVAKERGLETGITVQSFGMYSSVANKVYDVPDSKADMAWQVYASLAYGVKSVNYFTYWEHYSQSTTGECHTGSMVVYPETGGTQSVKTKLYDYVQEVNNEVKAFDHVFLAYDWVGTAYTGDTVGISGMTSDDITDSALAEWSSTESALISHMYDSEKQLDGFWVVNAENPNTGNASSATVTFDDGYTRAIVYEGGEKRVVSLNGAMTLELEVGEGIFIIPIKY